MQKYGQKILLFLLILIDCESNSNFHVFFALDLHMKTKRFCKLKLMKILYVTEFEWNINELTNKYTSYPYNHIITVERINTKTVNIHYILKNNW